MERVDLEFDLKVNLEVDLACSTPVTVLRTEHELRRYGEGADARRRASKATRADLAQQTFKDQNHQIRKERAFKDHFA